MPRSPINCPCEVRRVHFAKDQLSGSHRPPALFRTQRLPSIAENNVQGRIFTIRAGIPFDRWFSDYGLHHPLKNSVELWQARGGAVLSLGKGLVFSLVEGIKCVVARIFNQVKTEPCYRELRAQWHGVCLSAIAMISPNKAKEAFLAHWESSAHQAVTPSTFYLTRCF
ncbi:MAG: hypothetical protein KGZ39_02150 [Simkania sp.]|nr:hypothetical protein [Simkania sp.]